jgi:hypothetical protein
MTSRGTRVALGNKPNVLINELCEVPGAAAAMPHSVLYCGAIPQPALFMKLSKLLGVLCVCCTMGFAHAADILAPAGSLFIYAGKYPFDIVNGYSFFENPKVVAALDSAGGPGTADWVDNLDVGTTIARQEDGLIAAVCEAHNCSNNNAALAISGEGQLIALCLFSNQGDLGTFPGQAHWIGLSLDRYIEPPKEGGGCPRDADEFLEAYTRAIQ